jgi:hypothetical protein
MNIHRLTFIVTGGIYMLSVTDAMNQQISAHKCKKRVTIYSGKLFSPYGS